METEKDKQKGGVTVKKEKWMAGVTLLAMCVCLLFPVSVKAQEQTSGQSSSTTITTHVPEPHKATLAIAGKGTVTVNEDGTEVKVVFTEKTSGGYTGPCQNLSKDRDFPCLFERK